MGQRGGGGRKGRLTGAEAVSGDVDDVVAAGHDVHVAVFIDHARVARVDPLAIKALHVALVEAFFVAEQSGQPCGCERDAHDDIPHLPPLDFVALVVDGPYVEAGHGLACRAGFDEKRFVLRL